MKDPVYAFAGQGYGVHNLAVSDFNGRQVLSYITADMANAPFSADVFFRVGDGNASFEFGYATPVPGKPFAFSFCEVY